jgi:hypothetical protein
MQRRLSHESITKVERTHLFNFLKKKLRVPKIKSYFVPTCHKINKKKLHYFLWEAQSKNLLDSKKQVQHKIILGMEAWYYFFHVLIVLICSHCFFVVVGNLRPRSFCRFLFYYDDKVLNKQILTFLISLDVTKYSS